MPIKLAVFDCDGTLVDSQANICRVMEHAFATFGLPAPPRAATRAIVGLSVVEAMTLLAPALDPATHLALSDTYKATFRRMREAGELDAEPLYDGLVAALDALAADGWSFGVATGKSDRGLAHVLAVHGLADRFVTLQTADRHPSKPDPAMLRAAMAEAGALPHMTAMIGDTTFDMAMARAAGARAIGVNWGYHREAALWQAGAERLAQRCADLPRCLAECLAA
ncbi:MAG: HAD-IA family hydrolase [Sphingomonas phyllosphaerae]